MGDMVNERRVESLSGAYGACADRLVRFASATVGPVDAADVVSRALTRLLDSGTLERAVNVRAVLYQAVLWEAQSWRRSAWRRRRREQTADHNEAVTMPDVAPEVLAAVRELSPQQRAVTYLTYWEDMTSADRPKPVNQPSG